MPTGKEIYFHLDVIYTQSSYRNIFNLLTYSLQEELLMGLCKTPSTSQLLQAGLLGFSMLQFFQLLKCVIFFFYDLLNNFWGGTFWRILCVFTFMCIEWKGRV